jgi:hypothetical protein
MPAHAAVRVGCRSGGHSPGCDSAVGRVWRPGTDRLAYLPLVPERIDDLAKAPAVLIVRRGLLGGARPDCPLYHGVGVIGHQQGPAGRAADRAWAEPSPVRAGRCHPERRLADSELRDDVVPVAGLVQQARAERGRVERNGLAGPVNPQLWLDTRHSPTVAVPDGSTGMIACRAGSPAFAAAHLRDDLAAGIGRQISKRVSVRDQTLCRLTASVLI